MLLPPGFAESVFNINADFSDLACRLFNYQYEHNGLYHAYAAMRGVPPGVKELKDIPFLPVSFFKTHEIKTGDFEPQLVFESSGTTRMTPGRHLVKRASLYEKSFREAFRLFYGDVRDYIVIGLLPAYLERKHSSLVYMVHDMIGQSGRPESGFYLYEHEKLYGQLQRWEAENKPVLLIGVTFALLDFAEKYRMDLRHTIVMETGGMKGRREEWTRGQVHAYLEDRLGVDRVHSEYGMTELLSQAYSTGGGLFSCPPWMKMILRDETDPFHILPMPFGETPREGIINIIDLANIHSCAFIATDDIGRLYADGSFEVLGRMDNSDLRGCSLMVS